MTTHRLIDSPLGPLTAVADDGAVRALYLDGQRRRPDDAAPGRADAGALAELSDELEAYFAGELTAFAVALAPQGTAFQRRVWSALREIPYGTTTSYGELAREIGQPGAARAVGMANSRNPISIVVPCHRVVGSRGDLTGYAGGLANKRWLLDHERAHSPQCAQWPLPSWTALTSRSTAESTR